MLRFGGANVQFRVLGPFQIVGERGIYTPTASKVRQVMALLVLRANHIVSLDAIIEELWGEKPPKSAITTAQTYIYQLRKRFPPPGSEESARGLLSTLAPGYLLRVEDAEVDAFVFSQLLDRARALYGGGQLGIAGRALNEALAMWSGPILANVACGPLLRSYAAHLEEERMTALELRVGVEMEMGRHRETIAELKTLTSQYPLNEWLHGQLILALSRSGRRGEALRSYQEVRTMLRSELGLDPSAELQEIHRTVLTAR